MYAAVKKEFLIVILEPILDKKIGNLQILNPNLIQNHYKIHGQRLDLLVKTKDEIINVELNTNYSEEIKIRNLHYVFKLASENTERGNKYKVGYPIIQVNLNFYNSKYTKSIYTLYDKINKIELTDYIKIYNVGIDKYIKNYYNNDKKFTKGEEEQKQYEEVMYEKGLNQGIVQGVLQGKQQGLSEGIEKNKIDTAKKMLELNMDLETISKVTGLSIDQIESLRN